MVGEASDGAEAVTKAQELRPDVVLLDVRMPVRDGVSVVEELAEFTKVVMLTHTEDPQVIQTSLRRGASGYLVHGNFTLDELNRALREVVHGTGVRSPQWLRRLWSPRCVPLPLLRSQSPLRR